MKKKNLFNIIIIILSIICIIYLSVKPNKCECTNTQINDIVQKRTEIEHNYVLLDSIIQSHDTMPYTNQKQYLLNYLTQ